MSLDIRCHAAGTHVDVYSRTTAAFWSHGPGRDGKSWNL